MERRTLTDQARLHTVQGRLAESVRSALLNLPRGKHVGRIAAMLDGVPGWDGNLLDSLLAHMESEDLLTDPAALASLADESLWQNSVTGQWLVARALELIRDEPGAVRAWGRCIDAGRGPSQEARLARGRLLATLGRPEEAFEDLRFAAIGSTDYSFLAKCARVYSRLRRSSAPPALRTVRLAVLSSTTTELMTPLLSLAGFRDQIDLQLYVAPYGNFRQDILDPTSKLYEFRPDVVLVATNWRDADAPAFTENPVEFADRTIDEYRSLWDTLLKRHACQIIQHNFDLPAVESTGHLGSARSDGRSSVLRAINQRMYECCPPGVAVLDLDRVSAVYGKRTWFDASQWYGTKQHPSAAALPTLVDHQMSLIRAALGLTRKVLVLDLDNTMWGGVIGEDGLEGILLGPPSAVGEAHLALQTYAAELKERGILLAVCSKNNAVDARQPFLEHDSTVLRLDDFVAFYANWNDKPSNLRDMASKLNLGLDSFVFLDDSAVERALLRRELPQIAVPEPGDDPATLVEVLDRGHYFESLALSQEDRKRHETYRQNALREELSASAGSLDEFLESLQMRAEIGPFDEAVLGRTIQLLGKTNQFNLTTRRHTEEQVRRMMASEDYWTQYFRLTDRFGDNGLVGVLIARAVPDTAVTWEIDTWLMSCRVIGRKLEDLMLDVLVGAATAGGATTIDGIYIPTKKNGLVADLLPRLGFVEREKRGDGAIVYRRDLISTDTRRTQHIEVVSKEADQLVPRVEGSG